MDLPLAELGEAGKLLAAIGFGWTLCVKILVNPMEKRLAASEAEMTAINSTLRHRWLKGGSDSSE